jgi:hypothetical protein
MIRIPCIFVVLLSLAGATFAQSTPVVTVYQWNESACEGLVKVVNLPGLTLDSCERTANVFVMSPDANVLFFMVTLRSQDAYGNPVVTNVQVPAMKAAVGSVAVFPAVNTGSVPMQGTATEVTSAITRRFAALLR